MVPPRAGANRRSLHDRNRGRGARRAPALVARALLSAAALVALASACRREPPPAGAAASSAASAAPASSTAARAAPARSPRLDDPRWRLAAGDDPLDRARLAEAEGAAGLLDALADGGEIARTALAALPAAPDAELALGPLAERALAAPPGEIEPILQALLEIVGRPPAPREPLDPEGARAAAEAALTLAARRDLPAPARALAISAARAFARRGSLDPAKIPQDLDPG